MSRADSWDDSPTHPPPAPPRARKAEPVRDDWDDDASSADEEEDPHKLWEDANNRAPMPTVVIAGPAAASAPPVQALQPSMRILKRPSGPAASASATPSPTNAEVQRNLAEREAQYQAARQRIFGQSEGGTAGANTPQGVSPTPPRIATPQTVTQAVPAAKVLRNPRGPDSVSPDAPGGDVKATGPPRGFRRRGQQHPPRSTLGRGRSS